MLPDSEPGPPSVLRAAAAISVCGHGVTVSRRRRLQVTRCRAVAGSHGQCLGPSHGAAVSVTCVLVAGYTAGGFSVPGPPPRPGGPARRAVIQAAETVSVKLCCCHGQYRAAPTGPPGPTMHWTVRVCAAAAAAVIYAMKVSSESGSD